MNLADFFTGAKEGREDAPAPARGPRHASTNPDAVDRVMGVIAWAAAVVWIVFAVGILDAWWLS